MHTLYWNPAKHGKRDVARAMTSNWELLDGSNSAKQSQKEPKRDAIFSTLNRTYPKNVDRLSDVKNGTCTQRWVLPLSLATASLLDDVGPVEPETLPHQMLRFRVNRSPGLGTTCSKTIQFLISADVLDVPHVWVKIILLLGNAGECWGFPDSSLF